MVSMLVIKQALIGITAVIVLIVCAEIAVRKILKILTKYKLSTTFGGLVFFSVATSFPEIFSHIVASIGILRGTLDYKVASSTVLGANIGSDVIQQTLIVGIVVLFMGGLSFKKSFLKTAYLPMIGTTLMCIILGWDRTYSRLDGAILFGTFIAYVIFLYTRKESHVLHKIKDHNDHVATNIIISILAFIGMFLSAHFLLKATETIVSATGLGASLIGVVSLGVASAAPELSTAIIGLRKKASGISLGTLIGSNITNPLVAIGGGALISTYWVPRPLVIWDLPMETITAALLLVYLLMRKDRKLGRGGAIYLMGLYVFYLAIRIIYFGID